jgi:hypothetical protein
MRAPTAREAVAVMLGSYAVVKLAQRLLDRMERWARLHARVDGLTAVSAAYLGLPGDRTPYPAPWNEHPWDEPGWYGETATGHFVDPNGDLFVGPKEWIASVRRQHGADNPTAN